MTKLSIETTAGGFGTGFASGWTAYEYEGRWHWTAYGPRGGTQSTAASKDEAVRRAQAEAENLKR